MLTVADITTWLQGIPALAAVFDPVGGAVGLAVSSQPGWTPPDVPGPLIIATEHPGHGTMFERTYDALALGLHVRGAQNDPGGAETLMATVDDAVMGLIPPFPVGAKRCIGLDYAGSGPAWLGQDDSYRHTWTINYSLLVARTVF